MVGEIKSRSHGSANLSILMHQHQLLNFASMFEIIQHDSPEDDENDDDGGCQPRRPQTFISAPDHYPPSFRFLLPRKSTSLTPLQVRHLRIHYKTLYSILNLNDPELIEVDSDVEIWNRCEIDGTIFGSQRSRRNNSTRLNHLVCTVQGVDGNYLYRNRQENIVPLEFYGYVRFYCVHEGFRERIHLLAYVNWRKVSIHDGLVKDLGSHIDGFQDVTAIQHLCAKVIGANGDTYFVDDKELMEERLRDELL